MMPQKRNPDAAELSRAKSGRVFGNLMTLLSVMKALPLAYSKDMQEDKEPVFDSMDSLLLSLNAIIGMVDDLKPIPEAMYMAAQKGYPTATDLADWLVTSVGLPFREAHKVTGKIVKAAYDKNLSLEDFPLIEMQSIDRRITDDVISVLSIESSISRRTSEGGTAPENVLASAAIARKRYL